MQKTIVQPDVAYAAPSQGQGLGAGSGNVNVRENLSVIRSSVLPGFTLRTTLGEPREAAERLLSTAIAPVGSGK